MNRLATLIFCFLVSWTFSTSLAAQQELDDPYIMVQQVANQTFLRIKRERENITFNPLIINYIVEQELLPFVDYRFSALKVLGKYFREYQRAEIDEYVAVFKDYSVSVFSNALKYYDDQTVEFEPPQDVTDKKHAVVRMRINNLNKSINLSFLARKDSQTSEWRVYDIVAEGISMLSSLHSEFEPILRKEGLKAVVAAMSQPAK